MADEYQEYVTFTIVNKDGAEVEMAVIDEFEFEKKNYVSAALIEDDTINEDGLYIYKVKPGKDFDVEKITDPEEYKKVVDAYIDME